MSGSSSFAISPSTKITPSSPCAMGATGSYWTIAGSSLSKTSTCRRSFRCLCSTTAACAGLSLRSRRCVKRRRPLRPELFRFRLVGALPVLRWRRDLEFLDPFFVHFVKAGRVEVLGSAAAAVDDRERGVPPLIAIEIEKFLVDLAQLPAIGIAFELGPAEHHEHGLGFRFAFHLDEVDLHGGKFLFCLFRRARTDYQ